MKTYTEEEVSKLLETQRENCWVASNFLTKDKEILKSVINAPEPGTWRDKKQYFAVFETMFWIDVEELPKKYQLEDLTEMIKDIGFLPLSFSAEKEIKTTEPVKIPITKETKDFLETHCNIERNVVGEDTYVLNNLRFKIVEE